MKLTTILTIKAQLLCLSGLHIGAGDTEMHIGGIDNTVVRDPITQRPYIPGSSLKGKIRCLLECRTGVVQKGGSPLTWRDYLTTGRKDVLQILQLFGTGGDSRMSENDALLLGSTRLSFWDCPLTKEWVDSMDRANLLVTEAKSENSINRIDGTAGNPRYTERVIAGARFDFRLSMKVFNEEKESLLKMVLSGLRLLEMDSLGGSGSRGYGKVKFKNLTINDQAVDFEKVDPFS